MAEYVAGRGTTALGIVGTALGGLAVAGNGLAAAGNGLGGRFYTGNTDYSVIAQKDAEIAYWRGQDETNRKISDAYAKLENQINGVSAEVRANKEEQSAVNMQQAVYNGTNTATIACLQQQVAVLQGLTKTVVPIANVCPQPMPRYNSWTDPTPTTPTTAG